MESSLVISSVFYAHLLATNTYRHSVGLAILTIPGIMTIVILDITQQLSFAVWDGPLLTYRIPKSKRVSA
jgi:hypothetical protein